MSEQIPTVHQSLQFVALDISHIGKNQLNQQQRFKFRGIDDVLNAIHEPLARHGVAFIPSGVTILSETDRTTKSGSVQTYVRAAIEYTIIGPAGDSIKAVVLAEAADTGDKVSSKLMSMAYKYCAFQVLSIPVEGMDDGDTDTPEEIQAKPATRGKPKTTTIVPPIDEVHARLEGLADELGKPLEEITAKWRGQNGDIGLDEFFALPAKDVYPFVRSLAAYAATQRAKQEATA